MDTRVILEFGIVTIGFLLVGSHHYEYAIDEFELYSLGESEWGVIHESCSGLWSL